MMNAVRGTESAQFSATRQWGGVSLGRSRLRNARRWRFSTPFPCLLALWLTACERPPETLQLRGPIMGTTYTIRALPPTTTEGTAEADPALQVRVNARLEELNARLSTWVDDSDVVRFSQAPADQWVSVSTDTLRVVVAAREISEASDGAFDITVGPLVDLWGFGPAGQPEHLPEQGEIDGLLAAAGYHKIETRANPPALRKGHSDLRIDLSAIAKGYAVDEIAKLLDALGYTDYMVEIGGEVRTRGLRADHTRWRIALEKPILGKREILRIVPLSGHSMASSGDYRNYFELDGKRLAHTIDPRTGWPVAHGLGIASVVHDDCMSADAWATALMVLGADKGFALAEELGLAANLVVVRDGDFEERMTLAYRDLLDD